MSNLLTVAQATKEIGELARKHCEAIRNEKDKRVFMAWAAAFTGLDLRPAKKGTAK